MVHHAARDRENRREKTAKALPESAFQSETRDLREEATKAAGLLATIRGRHTDQRKS